ncbi:hypothetical protein [Nostoc sp. ChiQUE01b]|uniref:hypothetical protein n=1 Tax=Nostoc sp. ChiQUE01b TaxID=3075376 RepID=UPI002AD40AD0|nr:hypothetical protein [Nostoc sp. ChiQUE01b]MDZ8257986.1 hypothetical protein [Nostoc sp. ChiQUE01b]
MKAAEHITVTLSSQNLIVKPEVAQRQFETDAAFACCCQRLTGCRCSLELNILTIT